MKNLLILSILIVLTLQTNGQYPFENYPAIKYDTYENWIIYDRMEKEHKIHHTIEIPAFFTNGDKLTIQFTSFEILPFFTSGDSAIVRLYRNKKQIKKITEPSGTAHLNRFDTVRVADFNGDGLKDIKLTIPQPGCGIASLNAKVFYLFQTPDSGFTKISFLDMVDLNRTERDIDSNGIFEIITMDLDNFETHSYWTFNLYNYLKGQLINVNENFDYPIMVQYLFKRNFQITDKISRKKMKDFSKKLPDEYDVK